MGAIPVRSNLPADSLKNWSESKYDKEALKKDPDQLSESDITGRSIALRCYLLGS